jgi:oligopeptide/dipeptide ABC transporter ATP-binding protein
MSVIDQADRESGTETLRLRDIRVKYRGAGGRSIQAVRGVDLEVARGEIVGLVGESGCGKSSLARATVGLEAAGGTVTIGGRPIELIGRRTRSTEARVVQFVFQDPYSSLNPRRRVGSQIADGLRGGAQARAEVKQHVERVLELVGMPRSAADRFPHEFSGGQRQRLAIGRALAPNPSFLVADEPISSLDASGQASIAELLTKLRDEIGLGILLISHDLAVVRELARRVVVMYLGKVVETGPTGIVWDTPQHPYTQALIAAIPLPDGRGRLPSAPTGDVPDPGAPPSGCSFHPRCPLVQPMCRSIDPPEVPLGSLHSARCLLLHPPRRNADD